MKNTALFELLKVAIGSKDCLSFPPTYVEWMELLSECNQQLITTAVFVGIQKLPKEQQPPLDVYDRWASEVYALKDRTDKIVKMCRKACETHERNGFYSCVLMPRLRPSKSPCIGGLGGNPKDIDILCWSKDKKDGKRTIVEYVNFQYVSSTKHIKPKVVRQHVDWKSGNFPMNVNFKSSYLNCPWYNKRYEAWIGEMVEKTSKSDSCELPVEFYVVYQLMHLYKRFFCEDLRFGHLLEYYYTLKTLSPLSLHRESARPPLSPSVGGEVKDGRLEDRDERLEIMRVIENLGMRKFAGAVMYVLQTAFNMPDEYLLCKPDVRHGSFVLKLTNLAGEYGRVYERTRTLSHLGKIGRYLYWIKRNKPFITQYPSEMLFETYRKIVG